MVAITAKMMSELRSSTGAGFVDCKQALVEADGNFDEAVHRILRSLEKISKSVVSVVSKFTN